LSERYETVRAYLLAHCTQRGTGAGPEELAELIAIWGPLPEDFQRYLAEFGWATCGPHELLGLGAGVAGQQNIIDRTRELWRGDSGYQLPRNLLAFYESGGGWFYCLTQSDDDRVVCWAQEYEDLGTPQPYDETYANWSDWFHFHLMSNATS
jgi:hypothetical protein